jgi:hypothetical protein
MRCKNITLSDLAGLPAVLPVLLQRDEAPAAPAAVPAAAPAAAAPSGLASMRTPSSNLRMAVAKRASSFRKQHFQPGSEAAGVEFEGLQKLRQLCSQLGQDDGSCVAGLLEVREAATWLCMCRCALCWVCMLHLTSLLRAGSQGVARVFLCSLQRLC